MKKKFISLGLAVAMMLGVAGCTAKTPESVGDIGGVEIPAGIYLLAQYNAYNTASGYVELATGETANDVKTVLKASGTGAVGDEDKEETGREFVGDLTMRAVEYYAATEAKFDELGGTLDDTATAEAADNADSLWSSNGDLYTANGISKTTVQTYLLNSEKAKAIEQLLYGEGGTQAVTEADYTDYINSDCLYVNALTLPLYDSTSYVFATEDQQTQILDLAQQCADELNAAATGETALEDTYSNLYIAASTYLPQAYSAMGIESFDTSTAYNYVMSSLLTQNDISGFDTDDGNTITDALDAVEDGQFTVINMGTQIMVANRVDPLSEYTVDELVSGYNLLDSMKSDEVMNTLYEEGAAMEHNLSAGTMNTYKPDHIKKTV